MSVWFGKAGNKYIYQVNKHSTVQKYWSVGLFENFQKIDIHFSVRDRQEQCALTYGKDSQISVEEDSREVECFKNMLRQKQ